MSAAADAAVAALAAVKGDALTPEQQAAATLLAELIVGALDKKVKADGDAAVAGITTLEAAEASAGKR